MFFKQMILTTNRLSMKKVFEKQIRFLCSRPQREEKIEPEEQGKTKNRVYTFGKLEHGALGVDKPNAEIKKKFRRYISKPLRHYFAEENCVNGVVCGYGFTVFSLDNEDKIKLYGCGIGTDSQIGKHKYSIVPSPTPINIGLEWHKTRIVSMAAGRAHLAVVTDIEGVFMLGNNSYGQCGIEDRHSESKGPSPVKNHIKSFDDKKIVSVTCGQDHTLFLTEEGKVYACGWGSDGQTGQGENTDNVFEPKLVKGDIADVNIVKLACSSDTILALSDRGVVYGWGSSETLQLSKEPECQQINSPVKLVHVEECGTIVDIAAGGSFCLVLNCDGEVFVWGYGILGAGPKLEKSPSAYHLPLTLFGCNEFQPDAKVKAVYAGLSHLAAVNNVNDLYTWGKNRSGCLGIGHSRDQYFPYKVAINACVTHVSCGLDHTMVLARPLN